MGRNRLVLVAERQPLNESACPCEHDPKPRLRTSHTARRPSRVLAFFAHATLAYPLFLLASLYGQWLLSWYVLGHQPQPSVDDPKYIDGASWMHGITLIAIMGFLPAAAAALALNILYAVDGRLRGVRLAVRAVSLLALWFGTFVLLGVDPGMVLYWWFD